MRIISGKEPKNIITSGALHILTFEDSFTDVPLQCCIFLRMLLYDVWISSKVSFCKLSQIIKILDFVAYAIWFCCKRSNAQLQRNYQ